MLRALVTCAVTAFLYASARPQLPVCKEDDQCLKDFYCDVAFVCQRCLKCEQFKRDPPLVPSKCIKSVTACGSCIRGFITDLRGDVNSECVLPDARSDDATLPAYVWAAIIIGLLLFVLVVVIIFYIYRNTDTFKVLASTRASVQRACAESEGPRAASAPELPPPYQAHYTAVRPSSPLPDAPSPNHADAPHNGEESSWPFIKRSQTEHGENHSGVRESPGNQAARVYSNPYYVRGPHIPPNYDSSDVIGLSANTDLTGLRDTRDNERDMFVTDEVTMESTWTPTPSNDDNGSSVSVSAAAGGDLASQLEAARGTTLVCAPHAPHALPPCSWQDTNNNRNAGEALGSGEGSGAVPSNAGPSVIINLVQKFSAVQHAAPHKHNDPTC